MTGKTLIITNLKEIIRQYSIYLYLQLRYRFRLKMPQENSYSSFGGLFGEGTSNTNQAYKYNGKELDRMHGLDWYDYGARNYHAALPVWTTVDPLSENYYDLIPYNYVANNPVYAFDPDGRLPKVVNNSKSNFLILFKDPTVQSNDTTRVQKILSIPKF